VTPHDHGPSTIYDLPFLSEQTKRDDEGKDKMRGFLALISSFVLLTATASAQDAAYPNRAIKIVVSVPAGGGVDTVTRMVAEGLRKKLGQPVVVENHAGAGGNIGADYVFKSDPDGYTLLASQPSPITVNPLLYKNISFDPTKFEPVAIMTTIASTQANTGRSMKNLTIAYCDSRLADRRSPLLACAVSGSSSGWGSAIFPQSAITPARKTVSPPCPYEREGQTRERQVY